MSEEHSITLTFNDKCVKCVTELDKLKEFFENRPWKYGCRAVITIHQDFLGAGWHLESVEIDNREAENLRKEYEKSVAAGCDYDLQGLLNNLSWGGYYDAD